MLVPPVSVLLVVDTDVLVVELDVVLPVVLTVVEEVELVDELELLRQPVWAGLDRPIPWFRSHS